MDQGPLVTEQIDAGARFLGEFQKYLPVQAAFWLKDGEGAWWLYVASDQITDDNFDVVYGEVVRIAGLIRDPWFDLFKVKVIGMDDALAQAAAGLRHRYSGRGPIRFHGESFGGAAVEEVYLYPTPASTPVQ